MIHLEGKGFLSLHPFPLANELAQCTFSLASLEGVCVVGLQVEVWCSGSMAG